MSDGEPREAKRGPQGGKKHQPGRGHRRKSAPISKKKFRRKSARRREDREAEARRQWEEWDKLNEEHRKLLPEARPTLPRPLDS